MLPAYNPILSAIYSPIRSPFDTRRGGNPLRAAYDAAIAAVQAAGGSLWLIPPESYAPRAINGPFVGSDGSGGNPALGTGPVGWLRDASGGAIGPELVTNGDFSAGSAGWTVGTSWSISGGVATTVGGSSGTLERAISVTAGRSYIAELQISNWSANSVLIGFSGGTTVNGSVSPAANGLYRTILTAASGNNTLRVLKNSSLTALSIDNISVREIPGNHATQATSANRPVLVAAPGAAAAAAGFGAMSFDGVNDRLSAPVAGPTAGYYIMLVLGAQTGSTDQHVVTALGASSALRVLIANNAGASNVNHVNFQIGGNQTISRPSSPCVVEAWLTPTQRGIAVNRGAPNVSTGTFAAEPAWNTIEIGGSVATGNFSAQPVGALCVAPIYPSAAQRDALYRLGAIIAGV